MPRSVVYFLAKTSPDASVLPYMTDFAVLTAPLDMSLQHGTQHAACRPVSSNQEEGRMDTASMPEAYS